MHVWAIAALVLAGPGPAQGDLTAIYRSTAGGVPREMRVELAANGDMRGDLTVQGLYLIRKAGRTYLVTPRPDGPLVEDFNDLSAAMQDQMKGQPHLCEQLATIGTPPQIKPAGRVTIAGYEGEAYAMSGRPGGGPDLVLSRDPALAPIRAAMAMEYRLTVTVIGACATSMPLFRRMQELLESGAPLAVGPMRLEKIDTGPIDPTRFALPARPATREQVRRRMGEKNSPFTLALPPSH